ncbi:hypothetical protein PoB_006247300 [Plakobranchus ocellatus]|uniref:Uncharacterized protein n=1 Tax=Plakobranchus ocellatus TaxID=259542 RepID=A0AAV4CVP6_9GAST|nr:hypothetical protein PoB_006247300 [Plakobranchus ocellatus]
MSLSSILHYSLNSHVKLNLEKEHQEKAHADEIKSLNGKFEDEANRRVSQLAAEEELWKRERKEEGDRMQREVDKLATEVEEANKRADTEQMRAEEQSRMLRELLAEADVSWILMVFPL